MEEQAVHAGRFVGKGREHAWQSDKRRTERRERFGSMQRRRKDMGVMT